MSFLQSSPDADGQERQEAQASVPPSILEHCLGLIRRRWQLALAVWVTVMAAAVVVLWMLPRQFQSTARFLVKNARQELLVGPRESTATVYTDTVPEEVMNTELELLRSRDVIAEVVRKLHLDEVYIANGKSPAEAVDIAIHDLAGGLAAETLRKTNLIQISFMAPDPQLSNTIVRQIADVYLATHLALHSTPGTYELFKSQGEDANHELRQAEEEQATLARTSNLVLPEKQKEQALGSFADVEIQYAALSAQIHEMAARVQAAERKKLEIPQRLQTAVRILPNQYSTERLNTMLVDLGNRRTQLLTKFNADDRLVLELEQQIADTTAALKSVSELSATEESSGVNPAWQELESQSLKAQLELAGLTSKAAEVRKQIEMFKQQAQEIAEAGPRYEVLIRKVALAQEKYELYAKKEEEARIAQALDRERISNVVLAQAPYVASIPSSPDVRMGLVGGATIASILAACAVLAAEHLAATFVYARRRRTVGVERESVPVTALS
jgi:uncharacterized protein involved in exopolysaccharide biosynthesis